ncbi:DNA mismatch repair protein MutS [Cellulophaga baltica]|uniref:MutS-related protein n=1 Tax=Cellulophaga TaxID=104264 RepID=UPI001C069C12|nr:MULTISPECIES: DNA mismatch repair protein MutS [Cellulophaga]MBU2995236.1 DNA mismatch repair protein MutS [Cellulophaga baltica]MDO6766631.1 DNA mismatch repair protein MutS [Cellulophaga sp. 1_MG-2023]
MQELASFYNKKIGTYQEQLSKIKKELFVSSMVRLTIFILAVIGIYFYYNTINVVIGILIVSIALFLFLVSRHTDILYKKNKVLSLIKINETELKALKRDFYDLPTGKEYKNPLHHFSQDIDLFGKGSFYQYCNRTVLPQGSETLAGLFTENSINDIEIKQEGIKELAQLPDWRQEFSAVASLVETETPYNTILNWLANYKRFLSKPMKIAPFIFGSISILAFIGFFIVPLSIFALLIVLVVGLLITGFFVKNITKLSADTGRIQTTFHQYQKLILEIENIEFNSELLKKKRDAVLTNGVKTSKILHEFSRILGALDQRNNILFGIFANGFFLWDIYQSYKIEEWISKHGDQVQHWFETIAFFDAYNSLGNYSYNHPNYVFPKLTSNNTVLNSKGAGHPLLKPEKSVLNDIHIDSEQFFIITGANMAGKSTFLRTISLQIVMANVGLPVCAKDVEYSPIKLITSMRTTDSLTDDESYFFSELKRLRFIVDEIKIDRYFIVLDEILKGTNSTDKATGSRKFVEKLIGSKATGIIATHDLSLCEASNDLSQVENHYFDAEIIDNELHFDYKFKDGICQNMNASFLLKKMQIVD